MSAANNKLGLILGAVIILGGAGALFYFNQQSTQLDIGQIPPVEPDSEQSVVEVIPEADIPSPQLQSETPPETPPLPKLDDSDALVRESAKEISQQVNFTHWLTTNDLLRRSAAYIDGVSRGTLLSSVFALSAPQGKFTTHQSGEDIWLNAGNYERYDSTVRVITSANMTAVAKLFHTLRPLLTQAFAELGYSPRQMDGLVLQALDNIITTPVVIEPIRLTHESVVYKYADPDLEALSSLQKQLLRTGPENTQRIQHQAKLLRQALLNP